MVQNNPLVSDFTEQQLRLASEIDRDVNRIAYTDTDGVALLGLLPKHMPQFKQLMDTAKPGDMDRLCEQFDGLYRFAKVLESLAVGISTGAIKVPK